MTALFDPLRLAEVAWDVTCVNASSAQVLRQRQQTRLAALFEAARAAPVYRKHLADRPAAEIALTDLPVVHKHTLMRHFHDWVTDPALRLPQLQAFFDPVAPVFETLQFPLAHGDFILVSIGFSP